MKAYREYNVPKDKPRVERYPSDLSNEEWQLLEPYVRQKPGRGRKRSVNMREVVNALFYLNRTGVQWRFLPKDFPDWRHVAYYFHKWTKDGTWATINDALRTQVRVAAQREPSPSLAIIDAQSVKTTEVGGEDGFDAGKKVNGRKRNVIVDTLGLLLCLYVCAASTSDSAAGKVLLQQLSGKFTRLEKILADQTYRGTFCDVAQQQYGLVVEISAKPAGPGFQVIPKRWAVERSFGWLNRFRRLSKDYEYHTASSESMLYLAFIRLMLRRLTHHPQPQTNF